MAWVTDWRSAVAEAGGRAGWPAFRGRLGGVRVRASLAATVVVAVILAAAATAFVVLQRRQLETTLTDIAAQGAAAAAGRVARNGTAAPDIVPPVHGESALVQVVTPGGRVVAASPAIAGEPPIVDLRPAPGQVQTLRADTLPIGEEEAFAVVVRGVAGPDGDAVVISAESLETAQQATQVLVKLLAIGYPALLVLVAGTSYWLTGLALRPVDVMRRRVAGITADDRTARVPIPSSGDEVAQLATTMNGMLDRLAAATEAQRRFVADASHELRSPLATIRAAHEIAALHPDAGNWASVNTDVLAEVDRLERLVDDLLFLARSDEHGPRPRFEDVDLDDLVASETSLLRRITDLPVDVHTEPVRVVGDRHQIQRALRNLTDNAVRHAIGSVELRVRRVDHHAVLDVIDDGPGIPAGDRQRIFERFVRLDASRDRAGGGAGLGLAIAQEIAVAHGGDVRALEAPGAHLRLRLPLATTPSGAVSSFGEHARSTVC